MPGVNLWKPPRSQGIVGLYHEVNSWLKTAICELRIRIPPILFVFHSSFFTSSYHLEYFT